MKTRTALALAFVLGAALLFAAANATDSKKQQPFCDKVNKQTGACVRCQKGAVVGAGGVCFCPAGSGKAKTAGTTCKEKKEDEDEGGSKHGLRRLLGEELAGAAGGRQLLNSKACCPCKANFTSVAAPVASARCTAAGPSISCPNGTTAQGNVCVVAAGSFFDAATNTTKPCLADSYCPGGDITSASGGRVPCPGVSTTNNATGATAISGCIVPAGFAYDGTTTVACTNASLCCAGGPISQAPIGPAATAPQLLSGNFTAVRTGTAGVKNSDNSGTALGTFVYVYDLTPGPANIKFSLDKLTNSGSETPRRYRIVDLCGAGGAGVTLVATGFQGLNSKGCPASAPCVSGATGSACQFGSGASQFNGTTGQVAVFVDAPCSPGTNFGFTLSEI